MTTPLKWTRINELDLTRVTSGGATTNFATKGTVKYISAAKDGVYVIDNSDIENPVQQTPVPATQWRTKRPDGVTVPVKFEARDVKAPGDKLHFVSRDIDFSHLNEPGVFCSFDNANPLSPQFLASYQPTPINTIFRGPNSDIVSVTGSGPYTVEAVGHGLDVGEFGFFWINDTPSATFAFYEVLSVIDTDNFTVAEDVSAWNVANGRVSRDTKSNNNWYQNFEMIGDYAIISSQTFGLTILYVPLGSGPADAMTSLSGAFPASVAINNTHKELDVVLISAPGTAADGTYQQITNVTPTGFDIQIDSAGYSGGGTVAQGIALHSVFGPDELNAAFPGITPNINLYPYESLELFWECSGLTLVLDDDNGEDWAVLANHGNGLMYINITDLANPYAINPNSWMDGQYINGVAAPTTGYDIPVVQLRNRGAVTMYVDEVPYVLTCANTAGDDPVENANPERGLQAVKSNDPATLVGPDNTGMPTKPGPDNGPGPGPPVPPPGDWIYAPAAIADNDTPWIHKGDKPQQGITFFGSYAVIANGQRGFQVWDCSDIATGTITYLGLFGTDLPAEANLYQCDFTTQNGKTYVQYGNGYPADGDPFFYTDRVTGGNVADLYLGPRQSDLTPDETLNVTTSVARGAMTAFGNYELPANYELAEFKISGVPSDNAVVEFGIYPALSGTDGTPVDLSEIITEVAHMFGVSNPNQEYTIAVDPPIPVAAGNIAPLMIATSGAVLMNSHTTYSHPKSASGQTGLPATYPDNGAGAEGLFIAAGFNLIAEPIPVPPSLDTPYPDQAGNVDDPVSFDISSGWSGEPTSFEVARLPPGFEYDAATTSLTGTQEVNMDYTLYVRATNEFGTSEWEPLHWVTTGGASARTLWGLSLEYQEVVPTATPANIFIQQAGFNGYQTTYANGSMLINDIADDGSASRYDARFIASQILNNKTAATLIRATVPAWEIIVDTDLG